MKNRLFLVLTTAFMLAGSVFVQAAEVPLPIPVVVAESEGFELVGRLDAEGFAFFVDRAASNAPVLNAALEVEQGSRKATARFRSETGDYLIDDAAWLQPLRQPGEYALAFTLVAGEEADLLSADLVVSGASTAATALPFSGAWAAGISGLTLLLLLGGAWWRRRAGVKAVAV
ncbi:MAG: hypothetical protein U0989_00295 [Azonexus sp.]|nr:hypothetical protein [Azonexus sp.]MDZ4313209.1 hypothetical protein [Azonexus sp.]